MLDVLTELPFLVDHCNELGIEILQEFFLLGIFAGENKTGLFELGANDLAG